MPVAVHISPQHMSKDDYRRLIAELEAAGLHEPQGRLSHIAYGDDEVRMFETWESAEHFGAHRDDLFAALESVGLDAGCVELTRSTPNARTDVLVRSLQARAASSAQLDRRTR